MLERILKLYVMAMAGDIRSPLPHLFGPPGCGKSTSVYEAAKMLGVGVHTVNVSRLSPLEVEGVQMPHTPEGAKDMLLKMLHSVLWTQLKEGDILLLDEFLRGFPEVYNALLDILTSREVAGYVLPKVFIIAASNTTVAYDRALEDRLLHIPAPDPRKNQSVNLGMKNVFVEATGLLPDMFASAELSQVMTTYVHPMYTMLDNVGKGPSSITAEGKSMRKLIGMVKLREVAGEYALSELLNMNNTKAALQSKWQYVVLHDGDKYPAGYISGSKKLNAPEIKAKLTEVQRFNLEMNHQLIGLARARQEQEGTTTDDELDPFFE